MPPNEAVFRGSGQNMAEVGEQCCRHAFKLLLDFYGKGVAPELVDSLSESGKP